jgi:hypothetical protein
VNLLNVVLGRETVEDGNEENNTNNNPVNMEIVNTQFMANLRFQNMVNSEKDSNAASPITKCDNPDRTVNGQPEQLQVTSL